MIKCVFVVFQAVSVMIDVGKKKEKKTKKKKVQRSIPESRTESKRVIRRYCRYWNGGAKMAMPASPATWCWCWWLCTLTRWSVAQSRRSNRSQALAWPKR